MKRGCDMCEYAYIWKDVPFVVITNSISDALDAGAEHGVKLSDNYVVMPEYMYDYYTAEVH